MPTYRVTGACLDFGLYVAYSEQHAKDLCAIDAGYPYSLIHCQHGLTPNSIGAI